MGILVEKDLRKLKVEVRQVNDRFITIKLVVGGHTRLLKFEVKSS